MGSLPVLDLLKHGISFTVDTAYKAAATCHRVPACRRAVLLMTQYTSQQLQTVMYTPDSACESWSTLGIVH
eukprot:1853-Heterococcus_DN1.PRE.4